jgi:hypothetical protein
VSSATAAAAVAPLPSADVFEETDDALFLTTADYGMEVVDS